MADDLVTELSHLAKNLEQAADPCAAREARLIRRAILAINGLTDELAPYRAFNSTAQSYAQIDFGAAHATWGGKFAQNFDVLDSIVKPEKPKDIEPNAHVEGAPV